MPDIFPSGFCPANDKEIEIFSCQSQYSNRNGLILGGWKELFHLIQRTAHRFWSTLEDMSVNHDRFDILMTKQF